MHGLCGLSSQDMISLQETVVGRTSQIESEMQKGRSSEFWRRPGQELSAEQKSKLNDQQQASGAEHRSAPRHKIPTVFQAPPSARKPTHGLSIAMCRLIASE